MVQEEETEPLLPTSEGGASAASNGVNNNGAGSSKTQKVKHWIASNGVVILAATAVALCVILLGAIMMKCEPFHLLSMR